MRDFAACNTASAARFVTVLPAVQIEVVLSFASVMCMALIDDLQKRVRELEAENRRLRYAASLASAEQMRHILTFIWAFADAHDDRLPKTPSELRPYSSDERDWELFLHPVMTSERHLSTDNAWARIDELSSYELVAGIRNDPRSVVLREKRGLAIALTENEEPCERRWYFFGDGHGQLNSQQELQRWLNTDLDR